jgi:hypothetical protein
MMQVLRCRCGAKAVFLEGESFDCMGCDICMTTFAMKGEHKLLQPHKWAIVFDDDHGTIYLRCSVCGTEGAIGI